MYIIVVSYRLEKGTHLNLKPIVECITHSNAGSKFDVVWHTLCVERVCKNFSRAPKILATPLIKHIPEGSWMYKEGW